jgi:hypothetical protein
MDFRQNWQKQNPMGYMEPVATENVANQERHSKSELLD